MALTSESFEQSLKVIVVGNGQVGKTTMLRKYAKGEFTADYKKTIGTDFMQKTITLENFGNAEVQLDLWDTAGQEVFSDLCAQYYRGAGACAIAFSGTDRDSFDAVENWKAKVERVCGAIGDPGAPVMALVQTKVDIMDASKLKVDPGEADLLAKKLGLKMFRTSSKCNFNVDEMFGYLAEAWMRRAEQDDTPIESAAPITGPGPGGPKKEGFGDSSTAAPAASSGPVSLNMTDAQKGKNRAKGKKRRCTIL